MIYTDVRARLEARGPDVRARQGGQARGPDFKLYVYVQLPKKDIQKFLLEKNRRGETAFRL